MVLLLVSIPLLSCSVRDVYPRFEGAAGEAGQGGASGASAGGGGGGGEATAGKAGYTADEGMEGRAGQGGTARVAFPSGAGGDAGRSGGASSKGGNGGAGGDNWESGAPVAGYGAHGGFAGSPSILAGAGSVAAGSSGTDAATGGAESCENTGNSCGSGSICVACVGGKVCSEGRCECPSGTTECSGACYDTRIDSDHCGADCERCGSGQVCTNGRCECAAGIFACGGCLAWDFEWGGASPSPWLVDLDPAWPGENGAKNALLSHSEYQSANTSLAVPILVDLANSFTAGIAVSLCPTEDLINLAGYRISVWVLLVGPELSNPYDALQLDTWGPSGEGDFIVLLWGSGPIPTGTWFPITYTFSSGAPVDRIGLRLTPSSNWSGAMYIDDVVISPSL